MSEAAAIVHSKELPTSSSVKNDEILRAKKEEKWASEQAELKKQLIEKDSEEVTSWRSTDDSNLFKNLRFIGGVDISFDKQNHDRACAILCVLNYPKLEVVVEKHVIVEMTEPYIPGFLAFREVNHLLECIKQLETYDTMPQIILVDGNGVLHPRGFGLASHLGVLTGIPTIGVGKNMYFIDGMTKDNNFKEKVRCLKKKGDLFDLIGRSGRRWGQAVLTSDRSTNPVYVSVGHKISLETATNLVLECSRSRVPEPVRVADSNSKVYLREKPKTEKKSHKKPPSYPTTKPAEHDVSSKPEEDVILDGSPCQLLEKLSLDEK